MYDIIVIGGGICGLYFAYKYKGKCLLLEQLDRLGGKSYSVVFHSVTIPLGTGVGLYNRDTLLLELLNELGIEYSTYLTDMENKECLTILAKLYKQLPTESISFYQYISSVLTLDEISTLLSEGGYTDYLEADARTTLLHYGLQYNYSKYLSFGIQWNKVIEKMSRSINYKLNRTVKRLHGNSVVTDHGTYKAKNVIIATSISTVSKLLDDEIYTSIRTHPFLRVYAYFSDPSKMKKHFPHSTKTYNILHFIHPMRDGVYMIAYTDGADAVELNKQLNGMRDIEIMEEYLTSLVNDEINIDNIVIAYWDEGTHYRTKAIDSEHLRHPKENVYVIGECVSEVSGWTSPALEIVERLTKSLNESLID